jgi:serine/threonine protein kinase
MITVVNNNNNMSDSTPQAVISKMPPPQKDDVHFFGAEDERKPAADEVEIIGKVCGVDVPASIPLLDLSEVRLGSMLGTGGFCSVWYVRYISCLKQASPTHQESHHQKQARHRLALWFAETKPLDNPMNSKGNVVQPLVRKPQQLAPGERLPPRLALKKLLLQDQTGARIQGSQRDLETEISILLQLGSYDANTKNDPGHNNIVKIFAIGTAEDRYQSHNNNSISDDNTRYNFFVMDRLVSTLSSRMNKWRDTRGSLLGLAKEQWQGNFNRELWLERMIAIQSIGSAVSYMHSKSILFRDLKVSIASYYYILLYTQSFQSPFLLCMTHAHLSTLRG